MTSQRQRGSAPATHSAALDQLRHSERMAALGWLASAMAHELGNPLNVIELRAQLIASEHATLVQARLSATVILEQARRMTKLIEEVLSFARGRTARLETVEVTSVVRKAITLCEHTAKERQARVLLDDPGEPMEVEGETDRLLQVFVNLIINGVNAMRDGGTLRLRVVRETANQCDAIRGVPGAHVRVDITDQGVGIAPEVMAKIFEPFFSTRIAQGGTGLGLPVAQRIVGEHGGIIRADSTPGVGSTFSVHLPLSAGPTPSPHAG